MLAKVYTQSWVSLKQSIRGHLEDPLFLHEAKHREARVQGFSEGDNPWIPAYGYDGIEEQCHKSDCAIEAVLRITAQTNDTQDHLKWFKTLDVAPESIQLCTMLANEDGQEHLSDHLRHEVWLMLLILGSAVPCPYNTSEDQNEEQCVQESDGCYEDHEVIGVKEPSHSQLRGRTVCEDPVVSQKLRDTSHLRITKTHHSLLCDLYAKKARVPFRRKLEVDKALGAWLLLPLKMNHSA